MKQNNAKIKSLQKEKRWLCFMFIQFCMSERSVLQACLENVPFILRTDTTLKTLQVTYSEFLYRKVTHGTAKNCISFKMDIVYCLGVQPNCFSRVISDRDK